MSMTVNAATLRAMLDGLEGVTTGPYVTSRHENRPRDGASYEIGAPSRGVAGMMYAKDAAHFKRCDPATMRDILSLALSTLEAPPLAAQDGEVHPDDLAVDRFAVEMKAKLAKKRAQGRSGWEDKDACSQVFLSSLLHGHIIKGDPVDVANLAMMLHQRGETILQTPNTLEHNPRGSSFVASMRTTPPSQAIDAGDGVVRTMTGETVHGVPVLGWMTETDIPGVGPTRRTDYHWSTPSKNEVVTRLVDASALTHPAAGRVSVSDESRKGIYIASKVAHAERWRDLRDYERDPIISTWVNELYPDDLADLWARCVREASTAGAMIFYAEPGETFKGAWVELGAALSNGVPVFAVGLDKIEGLTIAHDKRITHCADMFEARRLARASLSSLGGGE